MADKESYQEKKKKNYLLRVLEEKLVFIITVPLLAILITGFVFHFYRVDGTSMDKTFQNNDLLIVEKLGKTTSSMFGEYVPKRYDVIVFGASQYSSEEELVKRVIALPGERVVIKNREIKVYNDKNPRGIEVDEKLPPEAEIVEEAFSSPQNLDVKLGKNEVFVLGDNRPVSEDSRYFGPIKTENIVGKVIVRILPISNLLIL